MAMLEIRGVRKSFHTYAKPGVRPGIFGRAPKPVSSLDVPVSYTHLTLPTKA